MLSRGLELTKIIFFSPQKTWILSTFVVYYLFQSQKRINPVDPILPHSAMALFSGVDIRTHLKDPIFAGFSFKMNICIYVFWNLLPVSVIFSTSTFVLWYLYKMRTINEWACRYPINSGIPVLAETAQQLFFSFIFTTKQTYCQN